MAGEYAAERRWGGEENRLRGYSAAPHPARQCLATFPPRGRLFRAVLIREKRESKEKVGGKSGGAVEIRGYFCAAM